VSINCGVIDAYKIAMNSLLQIITFELLEIRISMYTHTEMHKPKITA